MVIDWHFECMEGEALKKIDHFKKSSVDYMFSRNQYVAKILTSICILLIIIALTGCHSSQSSKGKSEGMVPEKTDASVESDKERDEERDDEEVQEETGINHDKEPPSLAETYAEYFPIGSAIEPSQMTGPIADLLKEHVHWLVAENAMKPSSIHPSEDVYNWEDADRLVQFAKENNMEIRFHTLVWHTQVGEWFFIDTEGKPMVDETDPEKRKANKELLLERLDQHVRTIVERYKDDIHSWDVVNEVVEPNDPDGIRASEWYEITGTDFIETAFRAAREAGGPDIKLYLNDYGTDNPVKRDRIYHLVKEMIDKGVPIDGIGHQTHIDLYSPPINSIIDSMKLFSELGLDNLVTELDMSIYRWDDHSDYGDDLPDHILEKQSDRYAELFQAFRENKDLVSGVVFWGLSDSFSWLDSFPVERKNAPLLFDRQFKAKPAFWSIVNLDYNEGSEK